MSATTEGRALLAAIAQTPINDPLRAELLPMQVENALDSLSRAVVLLAAERKGTARLNRGSEIEAGAARMWAYEARPYAYGDGASLWPLIRAFREAVAAEVAAIVTEARIVQRQREQARQVVLSFGVDLGGEA